MAKLLTLVIFLFVCFLCQIVTADVIPNIDFTLPITSSPFETTYPPSFSEAQSSGFWILVCGFIFAFILAFGVGANDVANVFGTSVGAKVVTLRQACIIATVFEMLGAVLIGYKVSDTVRKGILDVSLYNNTEKELMLGSLAALGGSSIWNILATFLKLPISGTHTIVGATVGFSLCARGFDGVNWLTFLKIVASWFVSPLLSGFMSIMIFVGIRRFVLRKDKPLEPGLRSLPFFYGFTILVNVFSIIHDGPKMLYLDNLPWWTAVSASLGIGLLVGTVVQCFVVPRQRRAITEGLKKIEDNSNVKFIIGSGADNSRSPTPPNELCQLEKGIPQSNPVSYPLLTVTKDGYLPVCTKPSETSMDSDISSKENLANGKGDKGCLSPNSSQVPLVHQSCIKPDPPKEEEQDSYEVSHLFSFLQILTATFGSFAHGGNDVSNAIGPLIAIWAIYTEGNVAQKSETPIYILLYGGLGISVGLWVWGRRVIQTIGENLTKVTPSSGFPIEIGSAFTVLLASKIGLPISTTHCKVGSVVFVGWAKSSRQGVDWKLFRNIVIAWVVTVPLTAGISALMMYIFRIAFL